MSHNEFMALALEIAKKSDKDIPVGCVIEKDGEIIASSHNLKEKNNDPTAHAEIIALKIASEKLKSWRLAGCNLYVTLEPCPMCAWAILNSGISNIYFGAYDTNYGALGSKINLLEFSTRKPSIYGGIMEDEAKNILYNYFDKMRLNN